VPLLREGVELYEFKPIQPPGAGRPRAGLFGSQSRASLHAKAYMIDRSILVIGSMNLDPRSAKLNTELALVVHSKPIADQTAKLFDRGISPEVSWRVELASAAVRASLARTGSPQSGLVWTTVENGSTVTYDFDPEAGFYRNLMTGIFTLLPVDSQL
jgi:cardiolipin synthase C